MWTLAILGLILIFPILLPRQTFAHVDIGRFRIGGSHQVLGSAGRSYLERWILWLGVGTLRLHRFHRGDDDRAPHNHPFWFVTFPLGSYKEKVFGLADNSIQVQEVEGFRFHFRPAKHTHIVMDQPNKKKFWTIVLTGMHQQSWGFYPFDAARGQRKFVPWREWI